MAAGSGTTTTTPRRFLLLLVSAVVVMNILSWTAPATLQLPVIVMTTAAQPDVTTFTFRTSNVRNRDNSEFMRRNMLPWARRNLRGVADFIRWTILCGNTKKHTEVIMQFEDTFPPPANPAYVTGNTINVNVGLFVNFQFKDDAARVSYFQKVVYHEMTHVWQFDKGYDEGQAETAGLVEGIADYAAAKGYGADFLDCQPAAAKGADWYSGYCYTAKFLLYLEKEPWYGRVVCDINEMLRYGYDAATFEAILGYNKPEKVWRDFLNSLVNPPPPLLVDGHGNRTDDVGAAAATATY